MNFIITNLSLGIKIPVEILIWTPLTLSSAILIFKTEQLTNIFNFTNRISEYWNCNFQKKTNQSDLDFTLRNFENCKLDLWNKNFN